MYKVFEFFLYQLNIELARNYKNIETKKNSLSRKTFLILCFCSKNLIKDKYLVKLIIYEENVANAKER